MSQIGSPLGFQYNLTKLLATNLIAAAYSSVIIGLLTTIATILASSNQTVGRLTDGWKNATHQSDLIVPRLVFAITNLQLCCIDPEKKKHIRLFVLIISTIIYYCSDQSMSASIHAMQAFGA